MSEQGGSFNSSLKWAFLMNWGDRAFSLVFTLILAAILGPRDFGIVALALIYIAVVQLFLEGGVQTAVIQREALEDDHLDSAFWLNFAWCLALAGISYLLAGWWARVNGVPELENVVKVLSILLVIYGLTVVQLAMFERHMRFRALAFREITAVVVGGVLGLVLAIRGAGVWALVAQQLGFAGTQLVLLWAMSGWRPRLRFSRAHARDLIGFSSGVFLSNLGGFINRRADALLMGIFFGPTAVGLYRLADRFVDNLLDVTMRPVARVSLPFFSRLQNDRPALKAAVASCIRTTLLLTVPAMAVLAACSDFVMQLMGDDWVPAADVLKLLAFVGIGKAVVFFTGPLLFAVARPHLRAVMLWVLAGLSAGTVVLVGWLLVGDSAREQAIGMAASRAAYFMLIVIPVNIVAVCWITGLRPREMVRWVPSPVLSGLAGIAAVAVLEVPGLLDGMRPFFALAIAGTFSCLAAGGTLFALEPRARALVRPVLRRLRGRPAEPAPVGRPTTTTEWSMRDR